MEFLRHIHRRSVRSGLQRWQRNDPLVTPILFSHVSKQLQQRNFSSPPPPALNRRRPPRIQNARPVPGVRRVIAVASGKGGVGKSTTAINLACAFQQMGWRTGLLDGDVYGPSVPLLMGLAGRLAEADDAGKLLIPLSNHGIICMSVGFMVKDPDTAAIWRGPMVTSALNQMLFNTRWSKEGAEPLDILVVDMPPGTGDAQLTLSQDIALIDARKGINMFKKVNVPALGIIQNMSYFICSKCSAKHHIFGKDGAHQTAEDMGLEVIGDIPLDTVIREHSDHGCPVVALDADSLQSRAYIETAKVIRKKLEAMDAGDDGKPLVSIVDE